MSRQYCFHYVEDGLTDIGPLHQEMKCAGETPSTRTYNALIRAYKRDGQLSEAQKVFRDMEEAGECA